MVLCFEFCSHSHTTSSWAEFSIHSWWKVAQVNLQRVNKHIVQCTQCKCYSAAQNQVLTQSLDVVCVIQSRCRLSRDFIFTLNVFKRWLRAISLELKTHFIMLSKAYQTRFFFIIHLERPWDKLTAITCYNSCKQASFFFSLYTWS